MPSVLKRSILRPPAAIPVMEFLCDPERCVLDEAWSLFEAKAHEYPTQTDAEDAMRSVRTRIEAAGIICFLFAKVHHKGATEQPLVLPETRDAVRPSRRSTRPRQRRPSPEEVFLETERRLGEQESHVVPNKRL